MSSLSDVPDALKNATLKMIFGETGETKKQAAEVKNGRGIMTSKNIELKMWRAPWLMGNHVY
jgi:hypothetical protein